MTAGFCTVASQPDSLAKAAAFAVSAQRFGYSTILLTSTEPTATLAQYFADVVVMPVTVNQPRISLLWRLKLEALSQVKQFDQCALCDPHSLIIRHPGRMFASLDRLPVSTPGGRPLLSHESWACPPELRTRDIARLAGIVDDQPVQTLNSGCLLWNQASVTAFLDKLRDMTAKLVDILDERGRPGATVHESLALSLTFAAENVWLPRADASTAVWDAQDLKLDIIKQTFACRKPGNWEGHTFRPFIANFGSGTPSPLYLNCLDGLASETGIQIPELQGDVQEPRPIRFSDSYAVPEAECAVLRQFVAEERIETVLEFGPGRSTLSFLESGCRVWSAEYQETWWNHYRRAFARFDGLTLLRFDNTAVVRLPEIAGLRFDLGFVDAPASADTPEGCLVRFNSCELAARHCDRVILHDGHRAGEQATFEEFRNRGWTVEYPWRETRCALIHSRPSGNTDASTASLVATASGRSYDFAHWPNLPRVTCQCITYGRTTLLDEAVESFLRQDYPGEKELVILNDLPTLQLRFEHPEVRVVNLPYRMRSIGAKRNACVALGTGQVIFPWDDDDISLPHRISYGLQQMRNRSYYKSDRLWYWANGVIRPEPRLTVAHAMGCWSVDFFHKCGGYPDLQSGQDMALENRFEGPLRHIESTPAEEIYYIYRFPGTGSYHLSSAGYGKGYDEVASFVDRQALPGVYEICPTWRHDYVEMVSAVLGAGALAR